MLRAQLQQARFKLRDLVFAVKSDNHSRYLVMPTRPHAKSKSIKLASAPLGAFLGFFSKDFRQHDFLLGRYNCYNFLKDTFILPEQNSVFQNDGTSEDAASQYSISANGVTYRQLIPLVSSCSQPELPQWPSINPSEFQDSIFYNQFKSKIEKRLDKIFDLLDIQLGNPLLLHRLWYGIPFVGGFRNFVLNKVKQVIDDAVKEVYDNAP